MNTLIPSLAAWIAGASVMTTWLWFLLAVVNTTALSHSGYHWPWLPTSGEAHDWHHAHLDEYFGALGLFDWLHGTDQQFYQSRQAERMNSQTVAEYQAITFLQEVSSRINRSGHL